MPSPRTRPARQRRLRASRRAGAVPAPRVPPIAAPLEIAPQTGPGQAQFFHDPQRTPAQHDDAIRRNEAFTNVMGHEQNAVTGARHGREKFGMHVLAQLRIQRREGFVQQRHRRIVEDRPGQQRAPPHPPRPLRRPAVARGRKARQFRHPVGVVSERRPEA